MNLPQNYHNAVISVLKSHFRFHRLISFQMIIVFYLSTNKFFEKRVFRVRALERLVVSQPIKNMHIVVRRGVSDSARIHQTHAALAHLSEASARITATISLV